MPEVHFYGVKAAAPNKFLVKAFGGSEDPSPLSGGQNTNYIAGNIVFKPSDNTEFSNWMAELFESLLDNPDVRFPRPIKSVNGLWIEQGYVAWTFLEGKHIKGEYNKKVPASVAFHKLLKDIPKPEFIGTAQSSWSTGDLVAWQKLEFKYDPEFMDLYNRIKPHLHTLNMPFQLVHGDLSGNFLIDQNLPPAIIDFSPAWAPNGFAEGIMFADTVAWEGADLKDLEIFKIIPNFEQFAWRGILRRITEQAEHIKWFDKDKNQALEEARVFTKAIDYLEANY